MANRFLEKKVAKFTWDFAVHGGANNSTIILGQLPDNSLVTAGVAHVITDVVDSDAGDNSTVSIGYTSATAGFYAATAVSSLETGSILGLLPGAPALGDDAAHNTAAEVAALQAASYIHNAAMVDVTITIGDDVALSAGKMEIFLDYVITE